MGRIDRSESNLFSWPKGAYIRNKRYLYINVGNKYVPPEMRRDLAVTQVMTVCVLEFCRIRSTRSLGCSMPTGIIC